MATNNLEERVSTLEKKFSEFEQLLKEPRREKDWRRTVGMFVGDSFFDEVVRLGREYREQENRHPPE